MAANVASVSRDETDGDHVIPESPFPVPKTQICLGKVPAAEPVVLVEKARVNP
jgi:hypothetical protein